MRLWQSVGLGVFAVAVLGSSAFVVTHDRKPPVAGYPEISRTPTGSPTPSAERRMPKISTIVEADFSSGEIPAGFEVFDTGDNETGMSVRDGVLTHGRPVSAPAASYLERRMPSDLRRIGAEVDFADGGTPGAIALIIWQDSLIEKRAANTLPRSAVHFVATPGSWHVGVIDPAADPLENEIAAGRYAVTDGAATFELIRENDTLWVIDPTGTTTRVVDPRIAEWSGRWANWELYEHTTTAVPAAFRRVWAG